MFTDERRRSVWQQIRQSELRPFASILTPQVIAQAAAGAGVAVGRGALNLGTMAWLAVASASRPGLDFCSVLTHTFGLLSQLGQLPKPCRTPRPPRRGKRRRSPHDPRKPASACPSEEAFAQARGRVPAAFWARLLLVLGELLESRHAGRLCWNGFRLLLLDGTCIALPRWRKLGEHFGYARNRRGTPRPQARVTMLLLGTVRMPWRYELTPRTQGEPTVAARLLAAAGAVRAGDLVLMDRGFFNYGLFRQIQEAGAFFAIRRIKRLRFRTTRRIGDGDRVVRWTPSGRRWRGGSIQLRVLDYQVKGFRRSAVVTNLLDERRVTREQLLGLNRSQAWVTERDGGLYHQRWEIETFFRELKCVQDLKGQLRGRTPAAIAFEVAGHVLLHLLVRFLMLEAALERGLDPLRLSFANALRQVKYTAEVLVMLDATQPGATRRRRRLIAAMLEQIASRLVPLRPGRHYPRPKDSQARRTGDGHKIPHAKLARQT